MLLLLAIQQQPLWVSPPSATCPLQEQEVSMAWRTHARKRAFAHDQLAITSTPQQETRVLECWWSEVINSRCGQQVDIYIHVPVSTPNLNDLDSLNGAFPAVQINQEGGIAGQERPSGCA
jgi:hypothetical protein